MSFQVAYRGAGDNTANANNAAVTVVLPTARQAGDLLILVLQHSTAAGTVSMTTGTGWTLKKHITPGGSRKNQVYVWYKVAAAGDVNPVLTPSGGSTNEGLYAGMFALYNYNWNNPFGAESTPLDMATGAKDVGPITPPDSSNVRNGAVVVVSTRATGGATASTLTGDGLTWTEVMDYSSAGTNNLLTVDLGVWPANTLTTLTNKTVVYSGGTNSGVGWQFIVNGIGDGISGYIVHTRGLRRRILPRDEGNFKLRKVIDDALSDTDV